MNIVTLTGRLSGRTAVPAFGPMRILEVRRTLPIDGHPRKYRIPIVIVGHRDELSSIADDEALKVEGALCSVSKDTGELFTYVAVTRFERLA